MSHPKPRITQVLWSLERAGAERMVFDLITCLKDRYDIRLVAAGGGGAMEQEFRTLGVEVVLAPPHADKLTLFKFLSRELREHRFDLLHTHLGGDVWAGLPAWWQGIHPWISTAHNEDQDDPWLRHLLRRFSARRVDHVACVSHVVKTYTHTEFGVPLHRLSVIPNGIDTSLIEPRLPRPFHDVPRLLSVGRLVKQKGHDVLLRGLACVKRPWRLDICGDGPDRVRLERLTESLGLLPRVTFHGVVSDVSRRLAEADVFCLSSRWEGQSLAMLEAAATAVPMVLSDLSVFHEWFDDASAEFALVGDAEAWARAIEQVLSHASQALARAAHAREMVCKRGTREVMAEGYAKLYERWLKTYAHSSRQ